jgi:hypothetical protein
VAGTAARVAAAALRAPDGVLATLAELAPMAPIGPIDLDESSSCSDRGSAS